VSDCLICARYREGRLQEGSISGYVYEDEYWYAYHAPLAVATPGQLFLVSKRHYLDFGEMTPEEAASYGSVVGRLYRALKRDPGVERIYTLITLEGIPHFHVWLIPRPVDAVERGRAFVAGEHSCSESEALDAVKRLREALAQDVS